MNAQYLVGPATKAAAVTPHASTVLAPTRALYVGGAGDIVVTMMDDTADTTFTGVTAGSVLPIRVTAVKATGTTATSIVALR